MLNPIEYAAVEELVRAAQYARLNHESCPCSSCQWKLQRLDIAIAKVRLMLHMPLIALVADVMTNAARELSRSKS